MRTRCSCWGLSANRSAAARCAARPLRRQSRPNRNEPACLVNISIVHQPDRDRKSLSCEICDAMLRDPAGSGQATLEAIDHANLFIVPLDNERRWYRYHQLFADLLRQRLPQSSASSTGGALGDVTELHL